MPEDFPRIAALMKEHADLPIGFVDASVATLAERLETLDIVSTDRRHFSVIRPRRGRSFASIRDRSDIAGRGTGEIEDRGCIRDVRS